ncbi:uncharacterized protein [Hoplias malabaricus]|uniref:uncharacterized protein n=1 Tax=Hoplias malabaricus TaxID=27720 RepID=UPI003461C0D0
MFLLSKRRRKTLTEAVYEEIDRRYITKRIDSTQRGSINSETQHSGYEDVDGEHLSAKSVTGVKTEYYDDVTTSSGLIAKEDTADNYDDVITAGQINSAAEDVSEGYDDIISADLNSVEGAEDVTENYDDAVPTEPSSNIDTMDTADNYDSVITAGHDVGEEKDYEDVGEEPQTEMNHVTERPHPVSFLRKLQLNLFRRNK